MRRRSLAAATAAAALAVPAAAQAHVTLSPSAVPAGAFQVLDVRVPNERDDASTVKVQMQMPPGVVAVSYQPIAGWETKVAKQTLSKPIQTPDGPITEAVSTITWTGSGAGDGAIAPGQFGDFPIQMQIPGKAGDVLTFKALQTYSNRRDRALDRQPELRRARPDRDRHRGERRLRAGDDRRDGARRATMTAATRTRSPSPRWWSAPWPCWPRPPP